MRKTPQSERPALHARLGRLLLATTTGETLDERLFDIVGHLDAATGELNNPAGRQAYELALDLHLGRADSALLSGNLAAAETLLDETMAQARDAVDRACTCLLQVRLLMIRPEHVRARRLALAQALRATARRRCRPSNASLSTSC